MRNVRNKIDEHENGSLKITRVDAGGAQTDEIWRADAEGMAGTAEEVSHIVGTEGRFLVDLLDEKGRKIARSTVKIKGTAEEETYIRPPIPTQNPTFQPSMGSEFRGIPRNFGEFMQFQEQERTRNELSEIKRSIDQQKNVADQGWLQNTIQTLQGEVNALRINALSAEREAYKRGFEDGKERGEDSQSGELDFKGLGDLLKNLRPQVTAPAMAEGDTPSLDLRKLLSMILKGEVSPRGAVAMITTIYGEETKRAIAAKKMDILREASTDPELSSLANGNAGDLLKELGEALDS